MQSLLALPMDELERLSLVDPKGVINIIKETLKRLDPRLIDHGDRVAFMVCELLRCAGGCDEERLREIGTLAFFHDIGAYKTEEIDRMVAFELSDIWEHSVYGYLFLKHFTPLGDRAEAILYHHLPYSDGDKFSSKEMDVAMLLHICDRVDILMQLGHYREEYFLDHSGSEFAPWAVELFLRADRERDVVARVQREEYRPVVDLLAVSVCGTFQKALAYLTMLVYTIDFKSSVTVTHTIYTMAFSVLLGRLMGMDEQEQCRLYVGGLLHDLGKMAIPYEILESDGKLSYAEMEIMKTHVSITYEILQGNISEDIRDVAARHHEKLDGTGYPFGLHAQELTQGQRVMAVADIMSALLGRRSYKESYTPDHTVNILTQMAGQGKLDADICRMVAEHYDEMITTANLHCQETIWGYEALTQEYATLLERFKGLKKG